jgi:ubiquitin thioesterase protein OTUB1
VQVEPLGKEVEQLQMMATIEALGAPIRVVYLERSPGGLNAHDLPEDGASGPRITMLYRPGHYDILYPVPGAP